MPPRPSRYEPKDSNVKDVCMPKEPLAENMNKDSSREKLSLRK